MKPLTLSALALSCALPLAAQAGAITTYGNRAVFNAAVGPVTVETFTPEAHFPITTGVLNSSTSLAVAFGPPINPGDIQPGATYSTPVGSGFFFNIDRAPGFDGGFLDGFYGGDPDRKLTVTFDNPQSAFGFDTNSLMGTSFNVVVNFTSGPAYNASFPVAGPGLEFFGFASSAADMASVVIDGDGNPTSAFGLDNFTFTQNGTVPEPGTLGLLVAGGVLAGLRRRKQS